MAITVTYGTEVDFADLATFADCDKARDEVSFRLDTHTVRDLNGDLADRRLTGGESRDAEAITRLGSEIGRLQGILASPDLDATTRQGAEDDLEIL